MTDPQPNTLQLMDLPDTAIQQLLLSVPAPVAFTLATTCRRFQLELKHNRAAIMRKMSELPVLAPVTTSQPLDKPHWVEQLVALQWQVKAGTMLLMMLTDDTVSPEDVWEQVLKGSEPEFVRMVHELGCHMQSALVPYGSMPPLLVWLLVLQLQGVNAAEFDLGSSGKDAKLKFAPAASRLQQLASQIYCNIKLLVRVEFASSMIESFWPLALQG